MGNMIEIALYIITNKTICTYQLLHLVKIELSELVNEFRLFLISKIGIVFAMVGKLLKQVEYQWSDIIQQVFIGGIIYK